MPDIILSYRGQNIAEITGTETITIKTGGRYVDDDITLIYVKPRARVEDVTVFSLDNFYAAYAPAASAIYITE